MHQRGYLFAKAVKASNGQLDPCTGAWQKSTGLPCKHDFAAFLNGTRRHPLQLHEIHVHWHIVHRAQLKETAVQMGVEVPRALLRGLDNANIPVPIPMGGIQNTYIERRLPGDLLLDDLSATILPPVRRVRVGRKQTAPSRAEAATLINDVAMDWPVARAEAGPTRTYAAPSHASIPSQTTSEFLSGYVPPGDIIVPVASSGRTQSGGETVLKKRKVVPAAEQQCHGCWQFGYRSNSVKCDKNKEKRVAAALWAATSTSTENNTVSNSFPGSTQGV